MRELVAWVTSSQGWKRYFPKGNRQPTWRASSLAEMRYFLKLNRHLFCQAKSCMKKGKMQNNQNLDLIAAAGPGPSTWSVAPPACGMRFYLGLTQPPYDREGPSRNNPKTCKQSCSENVKQHVKQTGTHTRETWQCHPTTGWLQHKPVSGASAGIFRSRGPPLPTYPYPQTNIGHTHGTSGGKQPLRRPLPSMSPAALKMYSTAGFPMRMPSNTYEKWPSPLKECWAARSAANS